MAELLGLFPDRLWNLARQCGVSHSVSRLPTNHDGEPSVEYMDLLHLKNRHKDYGFALEVIEPDLNWQMHNFKLGKEGGDTELEECKKLIRNMGAVGIPVFCYNFMAHFNWIRTSVSTIGRGGAHVTAYDHEIMEKAPYTQHGIVSEEHLWDKLQVFLDKVVPVAEEANVRLAIHPDDPPISPIRGISRIITSHLALKKVLDMAPSTHNGITLCQGTLSAAGENIVDVIEEFGSVGRIFFVHFRDVVGSAGNFRETFHDEGQTDMFNTVSKYLEVNYNGPVRVDHVPTMAGELNLDPGYEVSGRLYALGYLKGLIEGAVKSLKN